MFGRLIKGILLLLLVLFVTVEVGKIYLFSQENGSFVRVAYNYQTWSMSRFEQFKYDLSWLWYTLKAQKLPSAVPEMPGL